MLWPCLPEAWGCDGAGCLDSTTPRDGVDLTMRRVGLLTSWNTRCGIAEYSRHLAHALRRQPDVEVTVLGSRNHGDRAVREYEDWAIPVFDVQEWHPRMDYGLDIEAVLAQPLDVLHIQYSNLFFHRTPLVRLMRRFPGVLALTYHDKVVPPNTFPYALADLLYTHREDVGVGPRKLIPQGVEVRAPVVKTFGLGKSRGDVIARVCERNGWDFQSSFGEQRWLDAEELREWLRDSDAVVLWYDEDLTAGASAAAPLALGTRRPVFVNDTQWFRDVPERVPGLRKVTSPEELERELRELFADDYIRSRSWDVIASTLASDYQDAATRSNGRSGGRRLRTALFAAGDPKPLIARKRRLLHQTPAQRGDS